MTILARSSAPGGDLYRCEIRDVTATTDSTDKASCTAKVSLSITGRDKDVYQTLQPTSLSLGFNVPDALGPEYQLVQALISETDEHRYYVDAYKEGSSTLIFRGWVQLDQLTIPIRSQVHFPFSLSATCSLGQASNYDYIDPATPDSPYRGRISVKDHLILLLKAMDLQELYVDGEPYLAIATHYHNDEMPNTTDDYLDRILIDHRYFAAEVEENAKEIDIIFTTITITLGLQPTEPGNVGSVLEELCFSWNAALSQAYGRYYFVSRAAQVAGAQLRIHWYDRNGTYLSTTPSTHEVTVGSQQVNYTGYLMLDEGGVYSFLAPIKELIIDHNKGGGNNKIIGSEWSIFGHGERCFDDINNAGNAYFIARFPIEATMRYLVGNDTGWFRFHFGIKIKIGSYYLVRSPETDIFSNDRLDNTPSFQGEDITYNDAEWTQTEGYYEVVIDRRPSNAHTTPPKEERLTIVDIESPPIPESGVLCIDIDLIEIRKYDTFTVLFDDIWDTVTWLSDDQIQRDSKSWEVRWESTDNYLNIQSDDGELNEDTLAYRRYTAEVNPRNSHRLEYSTGLGDDPGSNTHGRIQIDRSVAKDRSDVVDADGGWTIDGAGTVYDNIVALLAWDMARLRVGVVRIMDTTIRSQSEMIFPMTAVVFDGKRSLGSSMTFLSEGQDYQGSWYTIDDVDSSKINIKRKLYASSDESNPNVITDAGTSSGVKPPYTYEVSGITTDRIPIPLSKPLPDPGVYDAIQINEKMRKAMRDTASLKYHPDIPSRSHFGIDIGTHEIVLASDSKVDTVWFFSWDR